MSDDYMEIDLEGAEEIVNGTDDTDVSDDGYTDTETGEDDSEIYEVEEYLDSADSDDDELTDEDLEEDDEEELFTETLDMQEQINHYLTMEHGIVVISFLIGLLIGLVLMRMVFWGAIRGD